MYLGKHIRDFVAEDPFEHSSENQGMAFCSTPRADGAGKDANLGSPEELTGKTGRLWALVGLLRRANSKLRASNSDLKRTNRQLSKENEALRSDLQDGVVAVESVEILADQK